MDIAITGHRPKDLGGYGLRQITACVEEMLGRAYARMVNDGDTSLTIHTGGALGTDQWVAQAIHTRIAEEKRMKVKTLRSVLHLPFDIPTMGYTWTTAQREALARLHEEADRVCTSCPSNTYQIQRYQWRNEHMVDSANYVVAFYNGKKGGGTYNCIRYALKVGKPVYNALDEFNRIKVLP